MVSLKKFTLYQCLKNLKIFSLFYLRYDPNKICIIGSSLVKQRPDLDTNKEIDGNFTQCSSYNDCPVLQECSGNRMNKECIIVWWQILIVVIGFGGMALVVIPVVAVFCYNLLGKWVPFICV